MNANHPTRRKFLANVAVVSAGTAFRPFTQLLVTEKSSLHLHHQWTAFCKKNRSVPVGNFTADAEIEPCKGHRHEVGSAVCFEDEKLLAQPTWIYWKEGNKRPDDVVISFFEKSVEAKRLFRMNRFELESLHRLQTAEPIDNCLTLFAKGQTSSPCANKTEKGLRIKTIGSNGGCSSTVLLSTHQTIIENKFIHSV